MGKIKKFTSLFLALIMLISSGAFISQVNAVSSKPNVSAHAYVVTDANSGKVIISQNKTKKIYPASTTKLLTAIVAIENCSLSKKITVKQSVLNGVDSEARKAWLSAGYTYTLEELLNMMLVYSAADAADIIADAVGGSKQQFVKMMNKKASELGMKNSYFDNPVGIDWYDNSKIYTTASDMTILARYAMANGTIRKIVKKPSYVIKNFNNGQSKTLNSSNDFLTIGDYSKDLFEIIGSKTGTTNRAGYDLIATAKDSEGREVICSFFGNSTHAQMYTDINELLTYTFKNYKNKLEKSFYNIRYSKSKSIINKYLSNGVLKMTSSGKFYGSTKVSKKEFINTTNKIMKSSNKPSSSQKKVTLLEVGKILKNFNKQTYSKSTINKYKKKFKNLSSSDLNNMVHLYELKILPRTYNYNEKYLISRQEMILMLDNLSNKVKSSSQSASNSVGLEYVS